MKLTDNELLYLMRRLSVDEIPDDIFVAVFSEEELTDEQVARIQPVIQGHMSLPKWV